MSEVNVVKNDKRNEYHREYYKNKVDKEKRKQQFKEYYQANKQRILARKIELKAQRQLKESSYDPHKLK